MSQPNPAVVGDAKRPTDSGEGFGALGTRISDREFALLRDLIEQESGIDLAESKRTLLVRRLQGRIRQLGLSSHSQYYRRVTETAPQELDILLDCVTTNETSFFREERQFETLTSVLVPHWREDAEQGRRTARLRVWSAACSSGEEPYSVAMALKALLPSWWTIEVFATDLCREVLAVGAGATYGADRAKEIPEGLLKRFVLRGVASQEGRLRIAPEVRELVRFGRINLVKDSFAAVGAVDLILCRNVLMYFSDRTRRRVAGHLLDHLVPGGHIFVGHAESLHGFSPRLRSIGPSMYRLRSGHRLPEGSGST